MKKNDFVGKTFYALQPVFSFGDLTFDYMKFVVEKVYQKSAQIKVLEESGANHVGKVKLEYLEHAYLSDFSKVVNWNKRYLDNSIKHYKEVLEGITPKNAMFEETKDIIWILKRFKELIEDGPTIDKLTACEGRVREYLSKYSLHKVGDEVVVGKRHGKVRSVHVSVTSNLMYPERVVYAIDYVNGDYGTEVQSIVKEAKK